MAQESQIQHRTLNALVLPYKTFNSPTSTDPVWQGGQNLYGTVRGYTVRRPGFGATLESAPTTFTNGQRVFTWHRWDGTANAGYYVMLCDVSGGLAKVYKFLVGTDTSFSLIFTSASSEPFDFVFANNFCFFGNGTEMKKYDGAAVTNWGITKPGSAPVSGVTAGGNQAFSGWYYRYTYYNSNTGHESSVSDLSACTGLVDTTHSPTVQVFASADSQVTNIKVYRTTDGGSTNPIQMRLVTTLSNTNQTYTDSNVDTTIGNNEVAPALDHNDPPVAGKGFVYSQNRIWWFANNKLYYTCYEENAKGVFEESWNSAADGNVRNYASQIYGLAKQPNGVAIFVGKTIYGVAGDSLDTFMWFTVLEMRGSKNRTGISSLGGSVSWIDTAKQVWLSDLGEIGRDIRPDLSTLTLSSACLCVHIAEEFHWICVSDPATSRFFVFNLDSDQALGIAQHWNVPWPVKITALTSGETADGVTDLIGVVNGTTVCKLTASTYTDHGVSYPASGNTNLFDINIKQDPEWVGTIEYVGIERNQYPLSDFGLMADEDTDVAGYTSIFNTEQNPKHRGNGTKLVKKRYLGNNTALNTGTATAQRMSLAFTWPNDTNPFALYALDISSRPGASS